MDLWERWNDDRNRLLNVKEAEIKSFNERIERTKLNLHPGINIQDWTEKEFNEFTKELSRTLQSLTPFLIETKVKTEYIGRNLDMYGHGGEKEYRFCECKIYLNGEYLSAFGMKF